MQQNRSIKIIVIIGYAILVALSVFGIVWIYNELVKFSETNEPLESRKELVIISNTLATMYQAEGTLGLLTVLTEPSLKHEYDSLTNLVFVQIDSLKKVSIDETFLTHVDSLSVLLLQKRNNMKELVFLMDNFENNTMKEITKETVLSHKNMEDLNNILLNNKTESIEDTSVVVGEKKGFFKRIRDAIVSSQPDTAKQISSSTRKNTEEIVLPILMDTITEFIKEVNLVSQRKNASLVRQMVRRQTELYTMNEQTISQIDRIMDEIEAYDYKDRLNLMKERAATLKRSSNGVALIAFFAMIIAIFFMSWIIYSISAAQRLQKEIEKAKKAVEDLLISREQLLLTISHDIKAPISSIIGYLELMKKDKPSKQNSYYVENMQQSSVHILNLVKDLLDFYSLDYGQQKINPMPFSPNSLITNIYWSFVPEAKRKELDFQLKQDINSTENYVSDPYRIRQILNNLLSNAIKFTPKKGSVTLSSYIEVINKENIRLVVSVKDTGPGIKEEDRVKIFEGFKRLDYSGAGIEGTGLGLNITQKLSQLLEGFVTVDSTHGKGSIFTVKIPLHPFENNRKDIIDLPVNETEVSENKKINKKIKALFIDDDVIQLNLLAELMKRENINYRICSRAIDALILIQEEQFDIIFSDIQMVDMNGFELVERIRSATFNKSSLIPIIGLSANSHIPEAKYKEAGFSGFLAKPFTSEQLLETIRIHTNIEQENNEFSSITDNGNFTILTQFAGNDVNAAKTIILSFINENNKNLSALELAFEKEDWETIAKISHKMISLMKMISAKKLVLLLREYENGSHSKENKVPLLDHIKNAIAEAGEFLATLETTEKNKE